MIHAGFAVHNVGFNSRLRSDDFFSACQFFPCTSDKISSVDWNVRVSRLAHGGFKQRGQRGVAALESAFELPVAAVVDHFDEEMIPAFLQRESGETVLIRSEGVFATVFMDGFAIEPDLRAIVAAGEKIHFRALRMIEKNTALHEIVGARAEQPEAEIGGLGRGLRVVFQIIELENRIRSGRHFVPCVASGSLTGFGLEGGFSAHEVLIERRLVAGCCEGAEHERFG